MATYVPALKGYVTDVPELWLKRKDDKVFHFDQLSSSNVSPDTQFTEVNGGWSLYPVAYLPGQSTMEMTFESAQFDADLFALATNTEFKDENVEVWGHAVAEAEEDAQDTYVIETEESLTGATIYINGFKKTVGVAGTPEYQYTAVAPENGDNPASNGWYELNEGVYTLTEDTTVTASKTYYERVTSNSGSGSTESQTADTTDAGDGVNTYAGFDVEASEQDSSTGVYKTRIVLADGTGIAKGDQISIDYYITQSLSTIQVDNQQTFVGEAMLRWPVYSSGEEVKAAGVKGYMLMHIYKCRCTAMPGFDTSYKSAVTNGITLSAMDPHRSDGAIYSMSFLEK